MNKITTPSHSITFTKLFAQRSGASFATVLNECFASRELLSAFNRLNRTNLTIGEGSGFVTGPRECADFTRQLELFAAFAWRDVFLQIRVHRSVA